MSFYQIRPMTGQVGKITFSSGMIQWSPGYYKRDGTPCSMDEWSLLFGDKSYQILKQTEINGYKVSTVWLGLNHNWAPGPPLIFETMVFPSEEQHRYDSEKLALSTHDEIVEKLRKELGLQR